VTEPQLTNANSLEGFHVEACGQVNTVSSVKNGQAINLITLTKALPRAVMMPPAVITTLEVGLACSARWLALKAPVFTASRFKAAHKIKRSPALTPFWLSSRGKT